MHTETHIHAHKYHGFGIKSRLIEKGDNLHCTPFLELILDILIVLL